MKILEVSEHNKISYTILHANCLSLELLVFRDQYNSKSNSIVIIKEKELRREIMSKGKIQLWILSFVG